MSNHRFCCCGDEGCTSPYRRFVPCNDSIDTTPLVMTTEMYNLCNLTDGIYALTRNPSNCTELYCGSWLCDPAVTADSDFCLGEAPFLCDCMDELTYYPIRPSDGSGDPCTLFEKLDYEDELEDGTCCDTRCPDRLSSCDSGPADSCADGERIFGCVCTTANDLAYDIDVLWSPSSDNGSQSSNRDYGTAGGGMVFDFYDSNVAMNMTGASVTLDSTVNCTNGDPLSHTFKVLVQWQGSVTQPKFPGYFDDGGQYGYVCEDAQGSETRVQSYSIDEVWTTTHMVTVAVSTTAGAPAAIYWRGASPADEVASAQPGFTCFGGSSSGTPYGMSTIADAFGPFGNPNKTSNTVRFNDSNFGNDTGTRVCAGNSDTVEFDQTLRLGFPGLPLDGGGYGFNSNYDAGVMTVRLSLAAPLTPENCP